MKSFALLTATLALGLTLAAGDAEHAVQLMQLHLDHVEAGLTFDRDLPTNDLSMALSSVSL